MERRSEVGRLMVGVCAFVYINIQEFRKMQCVVSA